MRRLPITFIALALACGKNSSYWDEAAKCATPRSGTDPYTGHAYPDRQGTFADEENWLHGFMLDLYLWYREVPNADPKAYTAIDPYFQALKTQAHTASGKLKDQFSFTLGTADWEALSQSGVEAGYGATWALVARSPPRLAYVAFTESGTPATTNNLTRGAQIISVDGVAVLDGSATALNAGLFPASLGETHSFVVQDRGSSTQRTVSMISQSITSVPVKNVGLISGTTVGYMLFNSHIATAEQELIDGITQLKNAGATDLVLDLRYNGGGYLIIASELAYMIAGPAKTNNLTFERTAFNDKYPTQDPVTGQALSPTPFQSQAVGLSANAGANLPHLDLNRVFVLVGGNTCSASEAVINGLLGANITVNLIGHTTCGKPYGFYPQDNCGTSFFAIEFQGVNAKGFGDYADGFTPAAGGAAGPPGCLVADDFTKDLGDPTEARLAAALQFRSGGTCPTASIRPESAAPAGDVWIRSNPFNGNRILGVPH
jgi:hypothetical protein